MNNTITAKKISFKTRMMSKGSLVQVATDVLGATNIFSEPGLSTYKLNDGTLLEFHGSGFFQPARIFDKGDQVVSFQVIDLEASVQKMKVAGAITIDGIIRPYPTYAFCHFILDNEFIIGLYELTA